MHSTFDCNIEIFQTFKSKKGLTQSEMLKFVDTEINLIMIKFFENDFYFLITFIDNIWINAFVLCNLFDMFRDVIIIFSQDNLQSKFIVLYQFLVHKAAAQRLLTWHDYSIYMFNFAALCKGNCCTFCTTPLL